MSHNLYTQQKLEHKMQVQQSKSTLQTAPDPRTIFLPPTQ